jgi:sugar/nucleoside kinase (ribokinase family)
MQEMEVGKSQGGKEMIIIGSGQYNWDVIKLREYPEGFVPGKRNAFTERILTEEAGGTCGNVMCMLAHLGWTAMPQVKLCEEGRTLAHSLAQYGCDTRYVSIVDGGGFSGMECTHRRNRTTGEHELGLHGFGPNGSRFRRITELRARDEVPMFLSGLAGIPDVYFFDHGEAGPRMIAQELRKRGALIFHECENSTDWRKFIKSVEVADVVKFSDENVANLSFVDDYPDKLYIQTQGGKGMQFKLCGGDWIHVPAVPVSEVVDWEGCGDTTTAVFLNELAKIGLPKVVSLTEQQVVAALSEAARMAAKCTQYYGSKGWLKDE